MREIKFRAKRNDMDRWIYGQYFTTPLTDENSGTKPDAGWFFLTGETRHCIVQNNVAFVIDLKTLGQYTGLKDKNGKDIYEGDIVTEHHAGLVFEWDFYQTQEVKWDTFGFLPFQRVIGGTMHDYANNLKEFIVVGNIHENPELLEDKHDN